MYESIRIFIHGLNFCKISLKGIFFALQALMLLGNLLKGDAGLKKACGPFH